MYTKYEGIGNNISNLANESYLISALLLKVFDYFVPIKKFNHTKFEWSKVKSVS